MPEPVIYLRGFPTSLTDPSRLSPAMLDDLKVIGGLSDNQVKAIQQRLAEATGFLSPKVLSGLLREILTDEGTVGPVRRALRNLGPNDVEPLLKSLSQQEQAEEPGLDETLINTLHRVLPDLIQHYPALARFEKAERLATLTGQELESIELICDLRPVFDESRQQIEGMIPYTRLHIVATGADGLPDAFEAELTQEQVHDLAKKASKAKAKLDVLRKEVLRRLPTGLPDLPLTRVPQEDPNDA